jgi:hypothetical protein
MSEISQLSHAPGSPLSATALTELQDRRRKELHALWQGILELAQPIVVEPPVDAAGEQREAETFVTASQQEEFACSPSEAVSVFASGEAVRIVVRDACLSAEEALRTAFATAGELAGRRSALQHLTLNGQVLYCHDGDATGRSVAAAIFA